MTKNKEVLEEIIKCIDNNNHNICIYIPDTDEKILMDDNLKKIIRLYYDDKLLALKIAGKE